MPDWNLDRIADRFQQAAFDPTLWPDTLHELSRSVGALGAVMLPLDHRIAGAPFSPELAGIHADYFAEKWETRDDRDAVIPLIIRKGIACDQDFMTPDGMMRRPYYSDLLARHGHRWFAGLGHLSQSGFYCISIQRTIRQGPFEPNEIRRLSTLCRAFADAGVLSRRLSLQRCAGLADALQLIMQPAMVLDKSCRVLALNPLAEKMMGESIDMMRRTLCFPDRLSRANFEVLFAKAMDKKAIEGPLIDITTIRNPRGVPLHVRAIALRDWVRYTFTGARVLMLFEPTSNEIMLRSSYGLTKAEARLALSLSHGRSVGESAADFGIAYETARSQLRSIFSKTHTNRQGQLVTLIRRLPGVRPDL